MRLSTDQSDRGYDPQTKDAIKHVTLDGILVRNLITADDDKDYIVKLMKYRSCKWTTLRAYGDVKIILNDGWRYVHGELWYTPPNPPTPTHT